MVDIGHKLFGKIHKQKHHAHHNHDILFLGRELDDWLVKGTQALIDGTYTPRFLKRCYFPDEMIDQLHISDRILQHILLKELKPTFPLVMSPKCFHLHGPNGVKLATEQVRKALDEKKPKYLIRADIKSYYRSIDHRILLEEIKKHYNDQKVQVMLERIITNPIETPRGYKNPDTGIALRGPLSQFFSALYLKPLDDSFAFNEEVDYFRYNDDILILCQSKRSLNRCKQRLQHILQERKLRLSGKKTRMGSIDKAFHFLGIQYPETRLLDNTNVTQAALVANKKAYHDQNLSSTGGGRDNVSTERAVSITNTHCSSRKNFAKCA
ncbi:reverse transcriptase domain-containing protein [Fluoribacter gormanii]|uniref:reverse transcriptase domain-containing protein n=1 Tax=Fluoribacter gormanii TaxID=464 RepID=UPI0022446633|nr:reverse transcriptase domain-containing protein [Fluoribacter gormanii]MCW8443371.1 reverse transcriptase domain-containing protein [Fluoribacter gormanii]